MASCLLRCTPEGRPSRAMRCPRIAWQDQGSTAKPGQHRKRLGANTHQVDCVEEVQQQLLRHPPHAGAAVWGGGRGGRGFQWGSSSGKDGAGCCGRGAKAQRPLAAAARSAAARTAPPCPCSRRAAPARARTDCGELALAGGRLLQLRLEHLRCRQGAGPRLWMPLAERGAAHPHERGALPRAPPRGSRACAAELPAKAPRRAPAVTGSRSQGRARARAPF